MKSRNLVELHATDFLEYLATISVILITSTIRQRQSTPMRKTAELAFLNFNIIRCQIDSSASQEHNIKAHSKTHIDIRNEPLVRMAVKHSNDFTNLVKGCLYWLTTCFGQLHDHHQVYKS